MSNSPANLRHAPEIEIQKHELAKYKKRYNNLIKSQYEGRYDKNQLGRMVNLVDAAVKSMNGGPQNVIINNVPLTLRFYPPVLFKMESRNGRTKNISYGDFGSPLILANVSHWQRSIALNRAKDIMKIIQDPGANMTRSNIAKLPRVGKLPGLTAKNISVLLNVRR